MRKRMEKITMLLLCTGYLLGISRGYLALWAEEDPQPLYVFSVRADTLPQADQQALRHGIRLEDQEALLELLQDYL